MKSVAIFGPRPRRLGEDDRLLAGVSRERELPFALTVDDGEASEAAALFSEEVACGGEEFATGFGGVRCAQLV
jgi:hypothetical protein